MPGFLTRTYNVRSLLFDHLFELLHLQFRYLVAYFTRVQYTTGRCPGTSMATYHTSTSTTPLSPGNHGIDFRCRYYAQSRIRTVLPYLTFTCHILAHWSPCIILGPRPCIVSDTLYTSKLCDSVIVGNHSRIVSSEKETQDRDTSKHNDLPR